MKTAQPHDDGMLRRSLSLLAGVAMMIGVGSLYAISAWNAQLKVLLHSSQAGISTVSSMALLGSYLSWFPGVVFDRLGPYKSVFMAGIGLFSLHLLMFAALTYFPEHVTPLAFGLCLLLVGQLGAFCIFSSIVPNEGLFGEANRGKIMALLTSSYSCGGAVFAFIYNRAFYGDVAGYFLFTGCYVLVIAGFAWCVLFRSKRLRRSSSEIVDGNTAAVAVEDPSDTPTFRTLDITGIALLSDAQFWLLFTSVMIVIGAGLFVMSNVSFIVEALDGPMHQVPVMVALFSLSNTIGRLATGAISDHVLHRYPRAYFSAVSVVLTALTQLVFLTIPPAYLLLPVVMAGVSEGVMFGIFPVIIRESFGLHHYGKNYGLISVANCIGYPLLYSPIGSYVYHQAATVSPTDGLERCTGSQCFRPVFLLVIGLCCLALVCCLQLARIQLQRRRHRYRSIP